MSIESSAAQPKAANYSDFAEQAKAAVEEGLRPFNERHRKNLQVHPIRSTPQIGDGDDFVASFVLRQPKTGISRVLGAWRNVADIEIRSSWRGCPDPEYSNQGFLVNTFLYRHGDREHIVGARRFLTPHGWHDRQDAVPSTLAADITGYLEHALPGRLMPEMDMEPPSLRPGISRARAFNQLKN